MCSVQGVHRLEEKICFARHLPPLRSPCVQGVFFRDWTVENARQLSLSRWVRNHRDGTMEAVFSGKPESVQEMVKRRCHVGPPAAAVTKLATFSAYEVIDPDQGFQCKPTV